MSRAVIRKLVTATAAVIENPFAGRYVEGLFDLIEIGAELGDLLGRRAVAALGLSLSEAESYGKAALVGTNGELEHAAAILQLHSHHALLHDVVALKPACAALHPGLPHRHAAEPARTPHGDCAPRRAK